MSPVNNRRRTITFDTLDRIAWIEEISYVREEISQGHQDYDHVDIIIDDSITKSNLHPLHLVLLACLILFIINNNLSGQLYCSPQLLEYLRDDLHLQEYFSGIPHIQSSSNSILNLWKISPAHSLMYSNHVANYLKNEYFRDKDVSMLRVVLDELFANIADHSHSEDLAYSFVSYNTARNTISIAFCDFGIGIKASLLKGGLNIQSDFIEHATCMGVTAKSNSHNRGFGLDTVVSSIADTGNPIFIISGNELFISYGKESHQRTWALRSDFTGTLIFFDIPISAFEDADLMECFEL